MTIELKMLTLCIVLGLVQIVLCPEQEPAVRLSMGGGSAR
jgi:hypothetical protein